MPDVRVCARRSDVKPGAHARFDVDGHRLCVVHIDDDWYVIGDTCSHADYSLSEGDAVGGRARDRVPEARLHVLARDRRAAEPARDQAGPRVRACGSTATT